MKKEKKAVVPSKNKDNKKTATNNQWVSTGLQHYPDRRERRDGPGGEDAGN